jgi:hypothetical protein
VFRRVTAARDIQRDQIAAPHQIGGILEFLDGSAG